MGTAAVIEVLGIECNSDTPDADGVTWSCAPIEGYASAQIRGGTFAPTGRHGLGRLQSFYAGRLLRLNGRAWGTQEAAWKAYYRLAAVLNLNDSGTLIFHEPTPKQLTVALDASAEPLISQPIDGQFRWNLQLLADFPFKTSTTSTSTALASGGTVSITNGGTSAAYPVVTASTAGTIDLVIGGRHFTTASVASGVYVDMWARTIKDGSGNDLTPWPKDSASEWLALPTGSTSVQQLGTADLEIVHYDTFA